MADALNADWKGHEKLHRKIVAFDDRYGNGIPRVDRFAQMLSRTIGNYINGRPNARGGRWQSSGHCAKQFVVEGEKTGATPDRRFAGEEMSKNVSPGWVRTSMALRRWSGRFSPPIPPRSPAIFRWA